jgi:hypothetical protein
MGATQALALRTRLTASHPSGILTVYHHKGSQKIMSIPAVLRQHLRLLYDEFLAGYATSPEGQAHRGLYESSRQAARANWQRVQALRAQGADYTDAALLGLLPHAASSPAVADGAWVSVAPAINGTVRQWFEAKGWATADEWPARANALVELLAAAAGADHAAFSTACAGGSLGRGIQAGMVSPILNALWPERYALCNTKSALVVERFDGERLSTELGDYPASNAAIQRLLEEVGDELDVSALGLSPSDALDMFAHWLHAFRGYKQAPHYLKVAPGEDAEDWQNCLNRGDIGIGWGALGDLTGLDRKTFDARVAEAAATHEDYTVMGTNQVWTLANAAIGDYVVATNGTKTVLGVGVIAGGYQHVPEVRYCHRRPVNWFSQEARRMDRPGWVKTVIDMARSTFEEVVSGPQLMSFEDIAKAWLQVLRRHSGFGRPFEAPFYLLDERGYKVEAAALAQELLRKDRLAALLDAGEYAAIIDAVRTLGQKTNLLWLQVPTEGDLNLIMQDGLDQASFCQAFFDLLWGDGASPERLDRFRAHADSHGLPAKWTFPTYFLFLLHPDSDYFVKPNAAQWMLEELDRGAEWDRKPNGQTYAAIVASAERLLELARPWGARDMIDVQGLVWVAFRLQKPELNSSTLVAAPLDQVFAGRAEAEWALNLMAESVERLGLQSCDDERIVISYSPTDRALKLIYGQLTALDFRGRNGALDRLRLALPTAQAPTELPQTFLYQNLSPETGMYDLSTDRLPGLFDEMRSSYQAALEAIRVGMAGHAKSGYRGAHVHELGLALFDADARERLLVEGFAPSAPAADDTGDENGGTPSAVGYFTARTFELLGMLRQDPRYAVYQAHEAEFQSELIEPFKQLLADVAQVLPAEWSGQLETSKRITSVIPKNDYGLGGAWPHYWGAFYTRGQRRTASAQLYATMVHDHVRIGFSIGDYGRELEARFWRNVASLADEVEEHILPTLSPAEGWVYGSPDAAPLTVTAWLAAASDTTVRVNLTPASVLAASREALVDRMVNIYRTVWPLFLLATLEEPWPAIEAYLGLERPATPNPTFSRDDVAAELGLPRDIIAGWLAGLERKGQAILYGPPGTGKTFAARALARHLVAGGYGRVELVQFHPAYAYEDFVEGIRPESRDGRLSYEVRPGLLRQFCDEARQWPDSTFVLIIDEINRANLSRVLGELMYLLEYRDQQVRLAVSGDSFSIPANVRLIGTMNTADRSIALVDHALRRRFAFVRLQPEWGIVERFFAAHELAGVDLTKLKEIVERLNGEIEPDYRVGITFFLRDRLGEQLESIWRLEIEPYLEEYFFDRPDRVDAFRWANIRDKVLSG